MTGSQDNYLMFRIGQIHTMVKQIHTRVYATPPAPSKSFIGKGVAGEFGRTILRALIPYLTPYILAALMGFGAMIVTAWKAFTRGWLGL